MEGGRVFPSLPPCPSQPPLVLDVPVKTDRLSDTERAMLMGGACAKAYGWSPKKA